MTWINITIQSITATLSCAQYWEIYNPLIKIVCILAGVAYFTVAERKIMASIQRRLGPNVVGFWGLLQPLADGFKLLCKELLIPTHANSRIFILAPVLILALSLLSWSVIPFNLLDFWDVNFDFNKYKKIEIFYREFLGKSFWEPIPHSLLLINENIIKTIIGNVANLSYGLLFLLALSGLNVYGIIIAGWSSNSKYAFLGSLRSAAQMISYEVSIGLVILPVILLAGSLNLVEIVYAQSITGWYVFPLFPSAIIFFVSMLAETNRSPFDLPEAEAELVAGYNVEYSSIIFAMFFLAEYSNMLLMSTLIVLLFFGGWFSITDYFNSVPTNYTLFFSPIIIITAKILVFCFLYVLVRATYPRYRYDQLMDIGWKVFLPITLGYLIFLTGLLLTFNSTPQILEITPQLYSHNIIFDYFSSSNNNNIYTII